MGILDFDSIFDLLDPARKGYLTPVQVRQFDETLHLTPICTQHVDAAIRQICGSQGTVKKHQFVPVLEDLERRRKLEEQTRWDFMALDKTGNNRVSLKDALMLFKVTHGAQFSMATWNSFLKTRDSQADEVYYDEVRMWLCNLPQGSPSSENQIETEKDRLEDNTEHHTQQEFQSFKKEQESDTQRILERQEYEDKTCRLARRKLNRWENEGIEGLLYDDGIDYGDRVPVRAGNNLGVNDLLDALDYKYDTLRRKLFLEMLRVQHSDIIWSSMSNSEQLDAFEQIQLQERQMRKDDTLDARAAELFGASVPMTTTLLGLMGEYGPDFYQRQDEMEALRKKLTGDGKTDADVDRMLKQQYDAKIKGPAPSSEVLISLHKRFMLERDSLMARLRSDSKRKLSSKQVLGEYSRLVRQHHALEAETEFLNAAVAVGLAEREQGYKLERYDPDRERQETLSICRLVDRKESGKMRLLEDGEGDGASPKLGGILDLQLQIVKELSRKHGMEREFLINMLQGKESNVAKSTARQLNSQQRTSRMSTLRNQRSSWRDSAAEYRVSQKKMHHNLLQEGVGVYFEDRRDQLRSQKADSSEDRVNTTVLADLQQKQDQEFETVLVGMQFKNEAELKDFYKEEKQCCKEEVLDNIATVILGTFECSEAEKPFLEMLEQKYEALRQLLLTHVLKVEHGIAWDRLAENERQKLLVKKIVEEKKMREEGRLNEMASLLSVLPRDMGTLRGLIGESRGEYSHRLAALYDRQQQEAAKGRDFKDIDNDELPASEVRSNNLLADLLQRYYSEQDALIGQLRSPDSQNASKKQWLLPLVLLAVEWRRAEQEGWFDVGAASVGLLERIGAAKDRRHKTDCNRQKRLARLRVDARTKRVEAGKLYLVQLDEYARPEKGDKAGWMEALLKEIDKKQIDEREMLLSILQDPFIEDLREAAKMMDAEDRPKRLAELQSKRKKMDLEDPGEREENLSILEEAAAIRSFLKKQHLESAQNREVGYEEVAAELLAELQDEQDAELAKEVDKLTTLSEEEMKIKREYEIDLRHWQAANNVLNILTRYEGSADDEEILKALEDKYDALRDKLLLEALMREAGEAEWARLSEQERQRRLMQLKLLEKKLRREGRFDELAKLLGDGAESERLLRQLMGEHRSEHERRLKERLARRQRRKQQGVDTEEDSDQEGEEGEERETGGNALTELQKRYEEEKDALLRRLRGLEDQAMGERERQAELVRLRREARRAQREGNFEQAAMLLGLAERQQVAAAQRFQKDRQRQEQLAKRRLELLRKQKGQKIKEVDTVIKKGDRTALQDVVLERLDEKHQKERLLLVTLLGQKPDPNILLIAQASSELERQEWQNVLRDRREKVAPEKTPENLKILGEACVFKMESRRQTLTRRAEEGSTVTEDDVAVSLLADLQERQDREAERYIQQMPEKDEEELIQLQVKVLHEKKHQRSDNIASVVLGYEEIRKASDAELMEALESKYDALRDKLLMEALIAQYGQASWQKMSEQERQRHLMEMRLKERQMRREGRWEELEQLLGAALQNRELLENLLGASKAEQERRLRERLAKRKERLANGMSEAECDELEREDEEERKKKRNVLKDLQDCYEQEKEELLRSLGQHHDKLSLERQRQAEITRLRREHRRSLLEEQFDAAALVMGLAKTQEAAVEAARKRQEELARQRLAARRGKLRTSADLLKEQVDVPMPEDDDDVVGLQEAVMREIERKHCEERELLMQLFNEDEVTIHQQTATLMTADQREDKLEELRTVRGGWRGSHGQTPQEQITIFKEAAGVRLVVTATNLATEEKDNSETEVQVALLADLQERQETENQGVLHDLSEQNTTNLKELKQMQNSARKHHWYDNVAVVLLGTERARTSPQGSLTSEEQEVVDALDRKYDAIRDKLLLQALQKQFGQKQWAEMSERERQAKLFKLKLQERKLRQEGRYDEAAALLGDLLENQAELEKALGESRSEQKQRLKERLRRKKKLIEERKAQGLSEDEATIEAILDQQEKDEEQEKKKRRNILESLQHHYDDEKAALLAALGKYDSQQEMERQRQLELAHLQRQQRQLEQEDKFDGAALLLNLAKQQELRLQDTMANERERQRALAMERIAARRRRGQVAPSEGSEQNLAANLKAADAEERMQIATESSSQEGLAKLQKAILADVEQRQTKERDVLLELVAAAEATAGYQQTVMNLQSQELKFELEKLRMECSKWQRSSRHQALKQAEAGDGQTQQDRDGYLEQVAHSRVEQFQLLTKAMVLRLAVEKTRLLAERGDLRDEDITEECSISLLADLQQRQQMENVALNTILSEQGEDTLHKVHDTQKMALREGWVDNVTNVVFSLAREDADNRDDAEEAEHSLDRQKIADNLQTEFNKEEDQLKTDLEKRKAAGEKVNTDAELARLRAQQEARKQAMEENLERQQRLLQEKLEARRRAQQNVELQNEAIMELLQTAERQHSFVYEKTQTEKGRQHELMSKRLAARKEARRQAMEKDRLRVSSASSGGSGRATSPKRPSSMDSNAPLGLKREKTVLDVNLSEQQKNEMYMEMVRQQTAHNRRLSLDQRRHEEQLKKRLEHIKTRRQSDAQELFMRAERQKSNLEKAKQDERDRHVSMTKERVARLRYEKTMTMKEKGSHQARKFDEMLSDGETKGMSEDEKMAAAARKVEETLRKEEKKEKKRKTPGDQSQTTTTDDEHDPSAGQGDTKPPLPSKTPPRKPSAQQERLSQLMAEAEKMKLLKQRRQSKKLERHQKQQPKQGQEQRRKSSTSSVDKGNKSDSDDIK